jgi:hypothetical protein
LSGLEVNLYAAGWLAVVPECFVVPENAGSTRAAAVGGRGSIRTISRILAVAGEVRVLGEVEDGFGAGLVVRVVREWMERSTRRQ